MKPYSLTINGGRYNFVMNKLDDILLLVDVKEFDKAWKKSGFYIGEYGKGGIGNRYDNFLVWLENNPDTPIIAPEVGFNEKNNNVGFTNGRHRFAVLRDLGATYLPVSIQDYYEDGYLDYIIDKYKAKVIVG